MKRRDFLTMSAGLALLAGCAPGSGQSTSTGSATAPSAVSTDPAKIGRATLTVWDQEVRGGGNSELSKLIASFQKAYPDITIKRVSRSFDDLTKTLRLALSGNDAPDVIQANNTRSQMGEFVKAKYIIPLDSYATAYKWNDRYSESLRATASYSTDAKTFGSGTLYGLPQMGEVVAIYTNKSKLSSLGIKSPSTWEEFEAALARAKSSGEVPLAFGNLDKWPAIHILGVLQGQYEQPAAARKLGYGDAGASWTSEGNRKALTKFQEWVTKGYFTPGFNGLGYDPAWQQFSKGKGVFLIAGTWLAADLTTAMKDNVGFILPPPAKAGGVSYTTGATSLPFAITGKCKNPDAAAAFINHITSSEAMKVIAETGNLPVVESDKQKAPDALSKQLFDAFGTTTKNDALLPYLDWATPTMSDTLGAALQDLLAKRASVDQTAQTIQKDYGDFTSK